MDLSAGLTRFLIPVIQLTLVLILVAAAILWYSNDYRMRRKGLELFIGCNGRKRWGPRYLIVQWQSQAMLHLARELSRLQHTIWLVRHRIGNLREMEAQVRKKRKELDQALAIAKKRRTSDSMSFVLFEIGESESKIADILQRINQNERNLQVMRRIMIEKKECMNAYKAGKNPKMKVLGMIRRTLSFMK